MFLFGLSVSMVLLMSFLYSRLQSVADRHDCNMEEVQHNSWKYNPSQGKGF